MKISIIGCGHMGSAIAKALISKGRLVLAGNPIRPRVSFGKKEEKNFQWTKDNVKAVKGADIVILAVRPNLVEPVLKEIKPHLKTKQVLLSIAAGTPLKKLKKWTDGHKKIVRMMPNLAAQALESMSVWKATHWLTKNEKKLVSNLLDSFGKSIEVLREDLIDAATAISGGGPAYIAAVLEIMASTAQKAGFSKTDSRLLALQTVLGSIRYIEKTGVDFTALKNAVQTKGGATEAGFKVLKRKKWAETLEKAFWAGWKRAQKLSKR